MLMKMYKVKFEGKILEFRELYNANTFCEKHGLRYTKRIFEPDIQPHAKNWFGTKGDSLTNRDEKEKERKHPLPQF